jgi:hypothetical protein
VAKRTRCVPSPHRGEGQDEGVRMPEIYPTIRTFSRVINILARPPSLSTVRFFTESA